ncbi:MULTISPECIES: GAF domain-containing protein [Bacillus]|uniref:GAF domain-containing protein n=1 Tax=Bacillus glycinifermentans TaxID=1664069 RepID=A0AAJ3Z0N9_9BACI|nr:MULTISPECIES: GAF domain-containing protein [Bacillus]KKB73748.1 histidine kinase [Bacillus sp. TH008]MBU8786979.1 GAF domain-containing protein [Bacillus glycinifermentans]MDU0073509.1 GAF domain-containing protein [Bacillus sp. IG6]MED8021398.1 GAF domain-containing protein [Bacillus glycinifermentans]QAT66518.1 GAF domain-containing protein [Bacillus glycinifermentans]
MFHVEKTEGSKEKKYELLLKQADALTEGEPDMIANLANASSLLYHSLEDVNWAGFYFAKDGELVLGPFQGLPACVRIPFGKGVCGTAYANKQVERVEDVNAFPGHIACDAASQSEIVIPLEADGEVIGVLDIDSPITNRFDEIDELYLKKFAEKLGERISKKSR